ncbi:hypothetical protein SAMN05720615_101482 [Stenotrophomonas indicatrix]|nr:hypothetical protein SAMN05720615_101482 [Stenotrophomonas indicatrix]
MLEGPGRAAPGTRRGNGNGNSNSNGNGNGNGNGNDNDNDNSGLSVGWRGGSGCRGRCKSPSGARPSRWRLCVRALAKQCFASKAPSPL